MRVWMWRPTSSARRMAPMRPSIMSEGATTSAPASAWLSACGPAPRRLVVDHVAGVVDQAVLAVAGVGIERDVGDDAQFGKAPLRARTARLDQPVRIPAPRPGAIAGMPSSRQVSGLRGDRQTGSPPPDHADRIDQIVGRQPIFTHQPARKVVGPKTARAIEWKWQRDTLFEM
jgi:hypothetical protein